MKIEELNKKRPPKPQFPLIPKLKYITKTENKYKQPFCKIGDFVYIGTNNRRDMSANNVGVVVDKIADEFFGSGEYYHMKVKTLDGKIEMVSPPHCGIGDHDMIEQVKNYYINVIQQPDHIVEKDM